MRLTEFMSGNYKNRNIADETETATTTENPCIVMHTSQILSLNHRHRVQMQFSSSRTETVLQLTGKKIKLV